MKEELVRTVCRMCQTVYMLPRKHPAECNCGRCDTIPSCENCNQTTHTNPVRIEK